ncbi:MULTISPECIES: winged helix-turn-helix transcriptional regulator [Pseudovibrio]|uniref:winged helix-turn-helix transcriptional regulator n=1 Tax=Stappiaceae TaxID=2821832 RepID=UPI00236559B6|nr:MULTISPECIES: helix-turn-helix domain-containing protein [Pseudovibrio]MDD7910558.1 helix-turn-helix domain-containing protein [Pseudovibrio exalbescens]MDX5594593.1 helix-turn-helix domain-containing protein [Pseudovibrio sp. SPO723]
MAGTRTSFAGMDCAIAQAIELIGDAWTLLILRALFQGLKRFDDFQGNLGISTSVLTDRLHRLVEADIIRKEKDREDARSSVYLLTDKGMDFYPVLIALNQWGERWEGKPTGLRLDLIERETGKPVREVQVLSQDYKVLTARDVEARPGPGVGAVFADALNRVRRRKAT